MRPDKVVLAAVAATLALYRAGVAAREIPVWRQIAAPVEALSARAAAMAPKRPERGASVVDGRGDGRRRLAAGRGAAVARGVPRRPRRRDRLLARLRAGDAGGRRADRATGAVVLDLRSVEPADDAALSAAIRAALAAMR